MTGSSFALFDTALGVCGLVWNEAGLAGVSLPERGSESMRAQLRQRFPGAFEAPPAALAAETIKRIVALTAGDAPRFDDLPRDDRSTPLFCKRVYEILCCVGPGATTTYGAIARALGDIARSREVGQALGKNPWPIVVPCHRVLGTNGKAGGFSAPGGVATKMKLLSIEQRHAPGGTGLFDHDPAFVLQARPPR